MAAINQLWRASHCIPRTVTYTSERTVPSLKWAGVPATQQRPHHRSYTTCLRAATRPAATTPQSPSAARASLLSLSFGPRRCAAAIGRHVDRKAAARHQSTHQSTRPLRPAAAAPPTSALPRASTESSLQWNEFLALRRRRRRMGLVFSVLTGLGTTATGLGVASSRDWDSVVSAALGLDPILVLALGTVTFAGLGWLIGPFIGNAFFGLWYRRLSRDIAIKDKEFYRRIQARRVDPASSSIQNPVPDYYGEKIGSVADYRRWLKDQRAFNLKRGDRRTKYPLAATRSSAAAAAAAQKLPTAGPNALT